MFVPNKFVAISDFCEIIRSQLRSASRIDKLLTEYRKTREPDQSPEKTQVDEHDQSSDMEVPSTGNLFRQDHDEDEQNRHVDHDDGKNGIEKPDLAELVIG
jgi:hypothetical protein